MSAIESVAFRGINVTPKTNWCFLEVRTADGLTGIGECTLANQEPLLDIDITIGKINHLGPLFGNGNPVGRHVKLALAHRHDHPVPRTLDKLRHAVKALTNLVPGIIIPPGRLAGIGVDVVER